MNRRNFIKRIFGILLIALGFKSIASVPVVESIGSKKIITIPKGYTWDSNPVDIYNQTTEDYENKKISVYKGSDCKIAYLSVDRRRVI